LYRVKYNAKYDCKTIILRLFLYLCLGMYFMKKTILYLSYLIIFFLFINKIWGQNTITDTTKRSFFAKPILSSEVYSLYPHYFIENSKFNYGFGGAITAQFKRAKYSLGLNYSTKKYYCTYFNSYYLERTNFISTYYNIPFSISFPLFNKDYKKKNDFIIGAGIIWNIPKKYEAITIYKHQIPYPSSNPYRISGLGVVHSFQFILRYQRRINRIIDIYLSGVCCYKSRLEYENNNSMMAPWSPPFSEDRLLVGLNIGVELFYKR
jgi:hypothetical protein